MKIEIKTITKEQDTYKVLYYKNIKIPGATEYKSTTTDADCLRQWVLDDIDDIVKAELLILQNKFDTLPRIISTPLAIALLLSTKQVAWQEYVSECVIDTPLFPDTWNVSTGKELVDILKTIPEDLQFALVASQNKNAVTIERHNINRVPKIKTSMSKTKTRNADILSWTNTFIKVFDNDISAHRITYQIQKTETDFKTRKSTQIEDVSALIDRELTPLRHTGHNMDMVKTLITKLLDNKIPKEIIASKELAAALNDSDMSIKIIESALDINWTKIKIQASILKHSGYDQLDIINNIISSVDINEPALDDTTVGLPLL